MSLVNPKPEFNLLKNYFGYSGHRKHNIVSFLYPILFYFLYPETKEMEDGKSSVTIFKNQNKLQLCNPCDSFSCKLEAGRNIVRACCSSVIFSCQMIPGAWCYLTSTETSQLIAT